MTMCGVCGREIKPRDGRRSLYVRPKGNPDNERKQRLVHDEPSWTFNCADLARGWESGGYGLSITDAAALGKLDGQLPLSVPTERIDGMGFADEYDPNDAPPKPEGVYPPFATPNEKLDYIARGLKLEVSAIRFGTSKHGEVAHLDVTGRGIPRGVDAEGKKLPPGRTLTFSFDGSVVTRDHMVAKMADWLGANEGETVPIKIVKEGRTDTIELV
jgi:hypothetical protein